MPTDTSTVVCMRSMNLKLNCAGEYKSPVDFYSLSLKL